MANRFLAANFVGSEAAATRQPAMTSDAKHVINVSAGQQW
jgi:hypothetical protein